jgi:EmrB/QacA subfamily drug resistance transporter
LATLTSTDPPTSNRADHRWLLMGFVAIAQLMVVLDATIVNIALPSAQKDLGFSDAGRQWVVTAYALAFGSLLLLGGRLADRYGRKRTFLLGLIGFAAASAVGGVAGSLGVLIVARALQGMFGALLAPSVLSTLATTFTDLRERGKAFGIFGTVAVSGGAVGLILGGILTEYVSWRWCMFVNIAFALIAVAGVTLYMPSVRGQRTHIDLIGAGLASFGLFAIVFGFSRAETDGWGSPLCYGFLVVGAVLLVAFTLSQRALSHPLLPLRIPGDRARGAAYTSVLLAMMAMFGLFLFLTYYLQLVKGFSPIKSGFAFLPMVACIVLMSNVSSMYLLPRIGPRRLIPAGMALGCVGMIGLSQLDPGSGYAAHVLPFIMLIGLGMGSVVAPSMNVATRGVNPADAGIAGALVNTSQQIGGSIGTAVLSSTVASATASYSGSPLAAATHGYATAFGLSAVIFAVGAALAFLVMPGERRSAPAPALEVREREAMAVAAD